MELRRFEFHDEEKNSHKFWEVMAEETDMKAGLLTTQWARIGKEPTGKPRRMDSYFHARAEAIRLIRAKLQKGYVEVARSKVGNRTAVRTVVAKPENGARNLLQRGRRLAREEP